MAKIKIPKSTQPKMSSPKMAAMRPGPTPKAAAPKPFKMAVSPGIKLTPGVETLKKAKKKFGL